MEKFLTSSEYIDWQHPEVFALAQSLALGAKSIEAVAAACFYYVRDNIQHSGDFKLNPVTCRASDVLKFKTGYCYAKSHLLAALLRANNIPAGLCYQRLSILGGTPPFCVHGLNAIYLPNYGWYRVDARGNKKGVAADFCPPREQLAFAIEIAGECDLPEIWAEPLPDVVALLTRYDSYSAVAENLPDILLWG